MNDSPLQPELAHILKDLERRVSSLEAGLPFDVVYKPNSGPGGTDLTELQLGRSDSLVVANSIDPDDGNFYEGVRIGAGTFSQGNGLQVLSGVSSEPSFEATYEAGLLHPHRNHVWGVVGTLLTNVSATDWSGVFDFEVDGLVGPEIGQTVTTASTDVGAQIRLKAERVDGLGSVTYSPEVTCPTSLTDNRLAFAHGQPFYVPVRVTLEYKCVSGTLQIHNLRAASEGGDIV